MKKIAKTAAAGKVSVTVELTKEQYEVCKKMCDSFRMSIGEVAKDGLFIILEGHANDTEGEDGWMVDTLEIANEDRETGEHPRFQYVKEAMAKRVEAA